MLTPKFEKRGPLVIAGHSLRFDRTMMGDIPGLWAKAGPTLGDIPTAKGPAAYGVLFSNRPGKKNFEYVVGIEVSARANLPAKLTRVRIGAPRYATFRCNGLAELRPLLDQVEGEWRAKTRLQLLGEPDFLERYNADFDPATGKGSIDVMVPLKS